MHSEMGSHIITFTWTDTMSQGEGHIGREGWDGATVGGEMMRGERTRVK